jgi:ribosomal protein S18 acetylase RimI-like enzyme
LALDAFKVRNDKLEILKPWPMEDLLERRYTYSLESVVDRGDKAVGMRFSVHPFTMERRRIRGMITIERARSEDLPKMAGMESLLRVRVAAKLIDLENRFSKFPDGILVARVGDEVIGYVEFVRWSREGLTKFREVHLIHDHHDVDGHYVFIWFLGVLPAFRGRGIGRGLISEIVDWSEGKNIRQLQIVTQPSLREYFEDLGFKKIADLDEYMPGMSGVFMARGVVL